jgi:hypothetical protein
LDAADFFMEFMQLLLDDEGMKENVSSVTEMLVELETRL